jgi:hypothetical protein
VVRSFRRTRSLYAFGSRIQLFIGICARDSCSVYRCSYRSTLFSHLLGMKPLLPSLFPHRTCIQCIVMRPWRGNYHSPPERGSRKRVRGSRSIRGACPGPGAADMREISHNALSRTRSKLLRTRQQMSFLYTGVVSYVRHAVAYLARNLAADETVMRVYRLEPHPCSLCIIARATRLPQ